MLALVVMHCIGMQPCKEEVYATFSNVLGYEYALKVCQTHQLALYKSGGQCRNIAELPKEPILFTAVLSACNKDTGEGCAQMPLVEYYSEGNSLGYTCFSYAKDAIGMFGEWAAKDDYATLIQCNTTVRMEL